MKPLKVCLLISSLLFSAFLPILISESVASYATEPKIAVSLEDDGIRVVFNDVDLYFNATNGGEITEYYDLLVDPGRMRNLVNLNWDPWNSLLPLFASLFYNPYSATLLSTGGDSSANVELIADTPEYAILQTSSRIMTRSGGIARDVFGNAIYVYSTWIIRNSGLVSVERTFFAPVYATIPSGWRWYPFKLTRTAGFNYDGTYYMFNTTYAYTSVVNPTTYRNVFGSFSLLPNDTRSIFGVAVPFSNTSIGGDGAHNILIAYKYDEMMKVDEWRTDNHYSQKYNATECGATHEFDKATNISTHTFHAIVNFTHQPVNKESVQSFANYYADNTSVALLMEASVSTNKDLYKPGDYYAFYGSGVSYYSLAGTTARLTAKNSQNRIVLERTYGPGDATSGVPFNVTLLSGTVPPYSVPDDYTLLLQIFSSVGILIASNSTVIHL